MNLIENKILKAQIAFALDEFHHVVVEKVPLQFPISSFSGGDADLALLKEGPGEHGGSSGELLLREGLLDHGIRIEDHAWRFAQEHTEHIAIALGQLVKASSDISHIQEGNISNQRQTQGSWNCALF